jgi:zinc/manganese transport system substrate-binding protein
VSRHRTTALALSALVALGLTGCSAGAGSDDGRTTNAGDTASCPGEAVDVVASVAQWGQIAQALVGDCGTVTTIIASSAVDPHDFEASTGDIAAFGEADLVVVNGADYDGWAESAVENLDPAPVVVSAAEVAGVETDVHSDEDEHSDGGEHSDEGHALVDPHLWYDPEVVTGMSAAISAALTDLSPDAADHFADRATAWAVDLEPYRALVAELASVAPGRTYAATETVFDRMAAAVGLTDATPEGYRRAASNESEPAPGDLTAFEAALADGAVDVLVFNSQTSGGIPEQVRAAAKEAGVPVVEVTESPADASGSFVEWQSAQLSALSDALSRTP